MRVRCIVRTLVRVGRCLTTARFRLDLVRQCGLYCRFSKSKKHKEIARLEAHAARLVDVPLDRSSLAPCGPITAHCGRLWIMLSVGLFASIVLPRD